MGALVVDIVGQRLAAEVEETPVFDKVCLAAAGGVLLRHCTTTDSGTAVMAAVPGDIDL